MEKIDFKMMKGEIPDIEEFIRKLEDLENRVKKADSKEAVLETLYEYFKISDDISTDYDVISIHFTQDTTNEEYAKAMETMDNNLPKLEDASKKYEKALLDSKHLSYIEEKVGTYFVQMLKESQKQFSKEIMEDLVEESRLASEYSKLTASAQIEYKGEVLNLSQLGKYYGSPDRQERKEASELANEFYAKHDEELGTIYDKLVHVRDKMAKKLGFENYLKLGYLRLGRLDYDENDVRSYREQILKYIVPLANKYHDIQIKRIKIDKPEYYDYSINFLDGNPKPMGTTEEKIKNAQDLYDEMDKEIGNYFRVLVDGNLLDLEARKGKASGGYECYIPNLHAPFIFSNFNGTDGDVQVLTHEFGHALQAFLGSKYIPAYRSPGMECCEMHSMSMEYLTYPYLNKIFDKENLKKYLFQHIIDAIFFIPYGVAVDEFQELVYKNPDMNYIERKKCWREVEKKYCPHKVYKGTSKFLDDGGYFYRQCHIFESPLYYIDYTIAQVVSLYFLVKSHENYKGAIDQYLFFSSLGGTLPYKKLLKTSGIPNPMEDGVIEKLIPEVEALIAMYQKKYEEK